MKIKYLETLLAKYERLIGSRDNQKSLEALNEILIQKDDEIC